MGDQEKTEETGLMVDAARAIGTTAGKVASALGVKPEPAEADVNPKLYRAEYVGSGTFIISKPKRSEHKRRQSQLKNPQRGSRKS
jgi:hypothetical protein